jgi:anti-sigma B factor antagonist
MEISVRTVGQTHRIAVAGEMDMYNSNELKARFLELLEEDAKPCVFNFDELSYIDSSGISVLIYIFTQSKSTGVPVWYTRVHGSVRKVIELTSLLGFLPITDTEDDAIRRIESSGS